MHLQCSYGIKSSQSGSLCTSYAGLRYHHNTFPYLYYSCTLLKVKREKLSINMAIIVRNYLTRQALSSLLFYCIALWTNEAKAVYIYGLDTLSVRRICTRRAAAFVL